MCGALQDILTGSSFEIDPRVVPNVYLTVSLLQYLSTPGYLVGDANDAASRTTTRIARLQGLFVAALAKVISAGVNNDGTLWKGLALSRCMPAEERC